VTPRHLIVNADDFGLTAGVTQAIVDCHVRGIVTSASLLVARPAAAAAARAAREHPELSVGLHFDAAGGGGDALDAGDHLGIRTEWDRQLERFGELTGQAPTHVDSHWHFHSNERALPLFRELAEGLGVPLRGDGQVDFIGGFYAQWEWRVTNLEYVSVAFLQRLLRKEVTGFWTELACHPGYVTPDFRSEYLTEREEEVRTLTDPAALRAVEAEGIRLASYRDYADAAA
jgi:predicted glycoside hydrolase/deacetylase ChbG (UPF0249 family)